MNPKVISRTAMCALLLALGGATMTAASADLEMGKQLFAQHCAVCHQANGQGQDGLAPPLTAYPSRYASIDEGRALLSQIALNGMYGEIETAGKRYNSRMPSFASLSDAELAAVLNHLTLGLSAGAADGNERAFNAEELKAQRSAVTHGDEVRKRRAAVLAKLGL